MSLVCLSVQGNKHFSRPGTGCTWPLILPTATEGVELICRLWLGWFFPLSWALSPEASKPVCLDVFLLTCDTMYWTQTFGRWDGGRELDISTDLHGQSGLQGATAVPSQHVCTILYSLSPCVSPSLSSIAMEKPCWCMYLTSVQMHLFEKKKWNLDISGTKGQLVSLFQYCTHAQNKHFDFLLKPYLCFSVRVFLQSFGWLVY